MPFRGFKHSLESKLKMSESRKGLIPWNKGVKGKQVAWNKGISVSIEMRKHLSDIQKGKRNSPRTEFKKGEHISPLTQFGVNGKGKGKNHYSWKGGITPLNEKIRKSKEYTSWRKAVFERDDFRCFDCGQRGGRLHAHHIYPFSIFPRLRLMLENGITLCEECHIKSDTWGSNAIKKYEKIKIIQYKNNR